MIINLWEFPPEDFDDWRELVSDPQVGSHQEYMTLLAALQADQERQGITVNRVRLTIVEMRGFLAEAKFENTPENRAIILARKVK